PMNEGEAEDAVQDVQKEEEEREEFSDEELEKSEGEQSVKERKKTSPDDKTPSPVPMEVEEEFDEFKDM
ncbi:MAG: hypothetical protein OXB86_06235, partial [Bdellovibrionales bacterium]|nr:hypothetical protein [Bdellovibrionales bacterium]